MNTTPLMTFARKLPDMSDKDVYRARSVLFRLMLAEERYSGQFRGKVRARMILVNAELLDRYLPIPI